MGEKRSATFRGNTEGREFRVYEDREREAHRGGLVLIKTREKEEKKLH